MPTVLIISASPLDQDRLRLHAEVKEIRKALQRSRNRENWRIESDEAVNVDDLRRALLNNGPTVVHFAGHGDGAGGLCFETTDGYTQLADAAPLARLFHHFKKDMKCVVLNACYSAVQANVIREEIDYVVGMRAAIADESARNFAVAFYDAVFSGVDFRTAFDLGCTALDLNNLPDDDVPVFLTSPHLERTTLVYDANIPEIERFLHAYINTPFAERASFTTSGDTVVPLLRRHYGEQMHRTIDSVRLLSKQQLSPDHWRVEARLVDGEDQLRLVYYLRIHDRSVLLEWEATVGLWSTPVKTFRALGSSEDVTARVNAVLGTYYNYYFAQKETLFQNVEMSTFGGDRLSGYVRRNTDVYDKLMTILSDGNKHSVTLGIANITEETSCAVINQLLSETWLYTSK